MGLAVAVGLALHLAVALSTDLSPDECYYAVWSHHLAWTYLDHPPAVAAVIALSRAIGGSGVLGVRLAAIVAAALVPVLLAVAAHRLFGARAAVLAAWLATATVLLHALGVVTTPDTPLVLAWAAALALAADLSARARDRVRRGRLVGSIALGVLAGLAILSKLTGWALLAGLVAGLVWAPTTRRALGARIALVPIGALAVAAPWIAGTLAHPAASDAAFQLARLREVGLFGAAIPALLGGQLGLVTPVLAVVLCVFLVKALRRRSDTDRLLLALSAPLLLAFTAVAFLRPVEANWPAPAWLAAIVGLAGAAPPTRVLKAVGYTAAPIVLLVHVVAITGLPMLARDPTARIHGWRALGRTLETRCAALPKRRSARLVALGYGLASEVLFVAPACAPVRTDGGGRPTELDRLGVPPWPAAGSLLALHREGHTLELPPHCLPYRHETLRAGGELLVLDTVDCRRTTAKETTR